MQEKGLDFRFLLSRKIDPPLRSVAVREARAKRATTACCGGKNFFLGIFSVYFLGRLGGVSDPPQIFSGNLGRWGGQFFQMGLRCFLGVV